MSSAAADREDVLDADPLVGVSMNPPAPGRGRLDVGQRRYPQGVAGGLDDVLERDALVAQA